MKLFYVPNDTWYFGLLLLFILVPSLIVLHMSLWWKWCGESYFFLPLSLFWKKPPRFFQEQNLVSLILIYLPPWQANYASLAILFIFLVYLECCPLVFFIKKWECETVPTIQNAFNLHGFVTFLLNFFCFSK